jgi:23S rRNA (guanosine2251-2'-O)-methyltransferase
MVKYLSMTKLNARQLRKSKPTKEDLARVKKNPIYLVIDEVLDTFNIGSMFRLADAIAAEKVYLCGNMEYPPSVKIHRAAIGTEGWVPWEKRDTTQEVVKQLKKEGVQIIAVEQHAQTTNYKLLKPKFPCAIVVGHETKGVKRSVLDKADIIVELPMYGINKSFNVWGSAAVVCYKILEYL